MLPHCESVRRAAGASPPIPLWGRTLLKSCRHRLSARLAWARLSNTSSLSNSSRSLPLKLRAKAILLRLARGDTMPANTCAILPLEHRFGDEFRPIVRHDHLGLAVKPDDPIQLAGDTRTGHRCVCNQRQTFTGKVVNHRQDPEPSAITKAVAPPDPAP